MTEDARAAPTVPLAPEPDDAEMRELYRAHGPDLFRRLLKLLNGDRYRAEDVLQETLVRAWRNPDARGPDGQWRLPWLYTVARNLAIDSLRARRAELYGDHVLDRPDRHDQIERMINRREVHDAVEALPERLRVVLIEIYLRERSGQETADRLGLPLGTVKSRAHYALRALRESLTARGFGTGPAGTGRETDAGPE